MENEKMIQEVLEELQKDDINTELIQDNKLPFIYDDNFYRCVMPSQKVNSDAKRFKNKVRIQLIKDGDSLTVKQLKKLLLEKQNINIDKMNQDAKKLEDKMTQVYLTLSAKKDSEKKSIDKLIKELDQIRDERLEIILEVADHLAPSVESQVQDEYYSFLTAMCTEKLINEEKDVWCNVWKSFNDYEIDKSKLSYIAIGKMNQLMYGV